MPGFDLDPKQAILFGDIQRAVRERKTTAELWDIVRRAEERLGTTLPEGAFRAVTEMRSVAASLRRASEAFAKASEDDPITARMIAGTIYERGPAQNVGGSSYHVRFSVPRTIGGEASMQHFTMAYDSFLPATVGELMDDLNGYAAAMSEEYGGELGDIQDIEIGRY